MATVRVKRITNADNKTLYQTVVNDKPIRSFRTKPEAQHYATIMRKLYRPSAKTQAKAVTVKKRRWWFGQ